MRHREHILEYTFFCCIRVAMRPFPLPVAGYKKIELGEEGRGGRERRKGEEDRTRSICTQTRTPVRVWGVGKPPSILGLFCVYTRSLLTINKREGPLVQRLGDGEGSVVVGLFCVYTRSHLTRCIIRVSSQWLCLRTNCMCGYERATPLSSRCWHIRGSLLHR